MIPPLIIPDLAPFNFEEPALRSGFLACDYLKDTGSKASDNPDFADMQATFDF